MVLSCGGSESSVAVGLARLGVAVAWAGRLGVDSFGDMVARELAAEGLHLVVHRDHAAPTGLMVKEQRASILTNVWYYRSGSAGSRLGVDDVPVDLVRAARILHVSGITPALSQSAADAVGYAVAAAREAGVLVSFDVNYRRRLWSREKARDGLLPLLKSADVVFAGLEEAELFVPVEQDPGGTASRLCELGPGQAVVKLGSGGCVAAVDGVVHTRAAYPVDVVDTVGAGDAFVAGYLAEQLAGHDVSARLDTGARLGAFACTTNGDWEGLPSRADLALLDQYENVAR